jgi:hypothetical protein
LTLIRGSHLARPWVAPRLLASSSRRVRWRWVVLAIAVGALGIRLLIVAHSNGGDDLRMYTFFSRLALHGVNPFSSSVRGEFPASDGNNPPLEVAGFAALLGLHDSPTTLRVLFALTDGALVLLVGLAFPRSRAWRAAFILFYAFNPFVLFSWSVFAEDKSLLFLGVAALLLALERGRDGLAWVAAAALTAFKFLGAFAAPALAVYSWRLHRWRVLIPVTAFIGVFVLSNLPWFPESLRAFSRRDGRLGINPPIHASPTIALARLGVYAPIEARVLTAAGIAAVVGFFVARRIDVREAVVWSLFAGYVFLPDDAFNRLLLITLPFLLIMHPSVRQWLVIWVVSSIVALAGVVATRGVPHELKFIARPLRDAFARESTVRHMLWMNLLTMLVLVFYATGRRTAARGADPDLREA